jgi:predicted nucleic acid-binding protein
VTEKLFVDTNVFVYAFDAGHRAKQRMASELLSQLWREQTGRTSMQVLNELYVTLTRKLLRKLPADQAWDVVVALAAWDPQPVDRELLVCAREIERRHRLSWWDSLIVAAAQLQDCSVLLSEDLQDGMKFGSLVVRDPFSAGASVREAPASHEVARPLRHRPRGRPPKVRGPSPANRTIA